MKNYSLEVEFDDEELAAVIMRAHIKDGVYVRSMFNTAAHWSLSDIKVCMLRGIRELLSKCLVVEVTARQTIEFKFVCTPEMLISRKRFLADHFLSTNESFPGRPAREHTLWDAVFCTATISKDEVFDAILRAIPDNLEVTTKYEQ